MPKQCVELFDLGTKKKDLAAMQAYFEPMFPISEFMGAKGYIRVAHSACELLGHPMGSPRRAAAPAWGSGYRIPCRVVEEPRSFHQAVIEGLGTAGVLVRAFPGMAGGETALASYGGDITSVPSAPTTHPIAQYVMLSSVSACPNPKASLWSASIKSPTGSSRRISGTR